MALTALGGIPLVIVPEMSCGTVVTTANSSTLMDAANEALIYVGQVFTSDGGSHTIDTTGSSSLGWLTGAVTLGAGTTVVVGLAAVDTANGPPARASNTANVVNFDVSKTYNGAGLSASTWTSSVPDSGTKTIANGDLVAFAVQMTARSGADAVNGVSSTSATTTPTLPVVTQYTGGSYSAVAQLPNCIITFSDGATGYFFGGYVFKTAGTDQLYNSGSSPNEYGNFFQLPVPVKIYGAALGGGPNTSSADCDVVLYSDPLGTPASQKSYSIDANAQGGNGSSRWNVVMFSSPYTTTANQALGLTVKPTTANNVRMPYKTYNASGDAAGEALGTNCYAINRSSGAFTAQNSQKDRFNLALIVGAFDDATGGGAAGVMYRNLMRGNLG